MSLEQISEEKSLEQIYQEKYLKYKKKYFTMKEQEGKGVISSSWYYYYCFEEDFTGRKFQEECKRTLTTNISNMEKNIETKNKKIEELTASISKTQTETSKTQTETINTKIKTINAEIEIIKAEIKTIKDTIQINTEKKNKINPVPEFNKEHLKSRASFRNNVLYKAFELNGNGLLSWFGLCYNANALTNPESTMYDMFKNYGGQTYTMTKYISSISFYITSLDIENDLTIIPLINDTLMNGMNYKIEYDILQRKIRINKIVVFMNDTLIDVYDVLYHDKPYNTIPYKIHKNPKVDQTDNSLSKKLKGHGYKINESFGVGLGVSVDSHLNTSEGKIIVERANKLDETLLKEELAKKEKELDIKKEELAKKEEELAKKEEELAKKEQELKKSTPIRRNALSR